VDQNSTQIYGKATFDREYPTSVGTGGTKRACCNSPVHEQWLLHIVVLVGRCLRALAAIVVALILQFLPVSFRTKLTRAATFFAVFDK
jgi:hypothetical protein